MKVQILSKKVLDIPEHRIQEYVDANKLPDEYWVVARYDDGRVISCHRKELDTSECTNR